jgi:hypothetical protein
VSWERGRDEILGMLERAELTRVVADFGLAERLIASAKAASDQRRAVE